MADRRNGDFPPSINAGRLYERMSSKGNMYLSGRFGSMRFTVMKTKDVDEDGHPIWSLMIGEAPPRNPDPGKGSKAVAERPRADTNSTARKPMQSNLPAPAGDEIPF